MMIWYEEDLRVENAPDGILFWIRGTHDGNRVKVQLGVDHLEVDGGPFFATLLNKVVTDRDPTIDDLVETFGARVERLKDKADAFDRVMSLLQKAPAPEAVAFVLSSTRGEQS